MNSANVQRALDILHGTVWIQEDDFEDTIRYLCVAADADRSKWDFLESLGWERIAPLFDEPYWRIKL